MFYVRKKRIEMITKTFRLPEDLVKRLGTVAQQQGVSMNNLVTQCCEYALAHLAGEAAGASLSTLTVAAEGARK